MKTNAILLAFICFALAIITVITAVVELSFTGLVMSVALALLGRSFYNSKEEAI